MLFFFFISWVIFRKINMLKIHIYAFPGGSEGLFAQKTLEITDDILATYKNQGTCGYTVTFLDVQSFPEVIIIEFYVLKVVMICWDGQKIKLEQLNRSIQHLMHAQL